MTDVSLNRKVRNFVGIGKAELLEGDDKKRKGGDAVDEARQ